MAESQSNLLSVAIVGAKRSWAHRISTVSYPFQLPVSTDLFPFIVPICFLLSSPFNFLLPPSCPSGLSLRVRLLRSLPPRYKLDIKVRSGTHQSEHAVNKQLNDKERVAAALENAHLLDVVQTCLKSAGRRQDESRWRDRNRRWRWMGRGN